MPRKLPASGWQCPDCGRRFIHATREHSCDVLPLGGHLDRTSPEVREAFQAIQLFLESLGPYRVVALKTMVVFSRAGNFAGAKFTRARLDLGFFLSRRLQHPRIQRVERLSPRKYAHHVHLASLTDFDSELRSWLREAFQTSASAGRE